ncbi:MAG: 3-oxoacyl-ACP reductase [Candidatus Muiribacterium halophilum]|uniref:3-oxoacyl-ACP reductase n=1 Tax=Muiribacterium halophilum TaxID=2053465 RepID=A0A2N5ZHA4_MUIH1|nr:MAG: 3-oxoacyl-ACP reductase [Candidatus Muirbacterium halophilum]
MRLKDKVAIITGGASGIGKITAKRFLEEGAKVIIFDIDQSVMDKALEELKQVSENVWSKKVNVADNKEVSENVDSVIKELGEVDIMVANAGITRDSMSHKMDIEKFDSVIDVNLRGSYNSARSVIEHMREKGHGKILFTSSVVGEYGNVGQANYAASKAGVIGMAKSMAKELARKNVQVNVVAPGYTNTDMMQTVPEKVLDMIRAKTPAGRLAKPEEIANAFVFLASEESNYITGHVLSVNGGLTL